MLDQEKVTRIDFSLSAVRKTCIVKPKYMYGSYYRNLNLKKGKITKDKTTSNL